MRVVGALALVLVLAGCGSASGSSLEDAADATAAETFRVDMSYRITAEGKDEEFKSAGLFDYPAKRGLMTFSDSPSFFGEDVVLKEVRVIDRTAYGNWAVRGKTHWVKAEAAESENSGDPTELLIPFPGSPTKPTDVLTRVLLASDENEEVGEEEMRGTDTTHYRARVDLAKLVKQFPAADRPEVGAVKRWGARFVPVEIWIDGENRLRRISIEQREQDEDDNAATMMTIDLFDYGVDVDVQPPEGGTISQEEFDKLTSRLEGGLIPGSGEGKPLGPPREVCAWARDELPKKEADEFCAAAEAAEGEEK